MQEVDIVDEVIGVGMVAAIEVGGMLGAVVVAAILHRLSTVNRNLLF